MATFFITRLSPYEIYALDSTSSIKFNSTGTATDHPLESGESVQDHYVNSNDTVSFSGTISSIKSSANKGNKSPDDFIDGLLKIKANKELFTITWHPGRILQNCVFTSLDISQGGKRGYDPETKHKSFDISFTAKQIKFAKRANLVPKPKAEFQDAFQDKTQGAGTTYAPVQFEITRQSDIDALKLRKQELENA